MKLILTIVTKSDSAPLLSALTAEGFQVTKLSTSGGLLKAGNTTLMLGVDDEKADKVIKIIEVNSSKRTQIVPNAMTVDMGVYSAFPVEVTAGGATIFVIDVDQYKKV